MLSAITCYFNPSNYKIFRSNYIEFRKRLTCPITTVELAFDDQDFFIDDSIKIRGNKSHILWQKERLLNIAIESLPSNVDKIVWIDADVIFHNESWLYQTEKLLDEYPVVQPFDYAIESSFSFSEDDYKAGYAFANSIKHMNPDIMSCWPKCGMCWAMRKEAISNGLFDKCIVGNGDALQLAAWMGNWDNYLVELMYPISRKEFLLSKYVDYEYVRGNIYYTPGAITHLSHGTRNNRQYFDRNKIIIDNEYDSTADITLDHNKLYTWSTDKHIMHNQLKEYFFNRRDDDEQ